MSMWSFLWRSLCFAIAGLWIAALTSCDQESEIRAQIQTQVPSGLAGVTSQLANTSGSISGKFNFDCQKVTLSCKVKVTGTLNGQPFSKTYTAELEAKGSKGGMYELECDDPLVAQFPDDTFGFTGTFFDPFSGFGGPMEVMEGLPSIETDPFTTLAAEPGHHLVIVAYPPGTPPGFYEISLSWSQSSVHPVDVKIIFTGYVRCEAKEYYPVILPPGLTDFGTIPAETIPVSAFPVPILPPLDGIPDLIVTGVDCSSLVQDAGSLSVSAGGTTNFFLNAGPANAGLFYLLLGSLSGTAPGLPLGAVTLPLNMDAYFSFTLSNANGPILEDTFGLLDACGTARAAFHLPAGAAPGAVGLTADHAYAVFDFLGNATFASVPQPLSLTP